MARKKLEEGAAHVRDRLLDTADRLFYSEGCRAIGIDRVLEEAGAAKASLYAHFGCKDGLIAAYVRQRIEAVRAGIEGFVADASPEQRALRLFDYLVEWAAQPDFRGCPLQHVVGEIADPEHPARVAAAEQRAWLLESFTTWAHAAGAADPIRTGSALLVLFDGVAAASEQDGPQRARDARWVAGQLLTG
jgi:AcrR family transcriptional regulator